MPSYIEVLLHGHEVGGFLVKYNVTRRIYLNPQMFLLGKLII